MSEKNTVKKHPNIPEVFTALIVKEGHRGQQCDPTCILYLQQAFMFFSILIVTFTCCCSPSCRNQMQVTREGRKLNESRKKEKADMKTQSGPKK